MNRNNRQKGFTLIELLLAMAFISVLLLAIALTIIQISNIYNRSMILKEVNQVGRGLSSEIQKSVTESVPFSIEQTAGSHYFQQEDWGGRLCMGRYSYIWNYGSVLQPNTSPTRNLYKNEASLIKTNSNPIRLVKVNDSQAAYCSDLDLAVDPAAATELLDVGDHGLALQDFSISTTLAAGDTKTGQRLYTISFAVGTNELEALTDDRKSCKPPGVLGADLSYCVVQEFNIISRAGNMVK